MQRGGKKFCSSSFTLIESMICISIIMLLASLILPRFSKQADADLLTDLDHLFAVITYLQQRAIATNTVQELIFDREKQSYYFVKNDKQQLKLLQSTVQFGYVPGALGPPSSPTEPLVMPITFNHKEYSSTISARFFPDGKISSGTIYLIDVKQTMMVALTTPVSDISSIRMYKYLDNRWIVMTHANK